MSETLKENIYQKSMIRGCICYHRIFDKWGADYGVVAENMVLF